VQSGLIGKVCSLVIKKKWTVWLNRVSVQSGYIGKSGQSGKIGKVGILVK